MPAVQWKYNAKTFSFCEAPSDLYTEGDEKIKGAKRGIHYSKDLRTRIIWEFVAFKQSIGAEYNLRLETKDFWGRWSTIDQYMRVTTLEGLNPQGVFDINNNPLL